MKPIACVDLDGVLCSWEDGWRGAHHFGEPIPGAQDFLRDLRKDFDVVIFSCRCSEEIGKPEKGYLLANRVRAWLDANGFEYDDVFAGQGKPVASVYIDDRGVTCRPEESKDPSEAFANAARASRVLAGIKYEANKDD